MLGNEVATLVDEYREAGRYEVEFQSAAGNRQPALPSGRLASGIYFYQLLASALQSKDGKEGSFVETKKILLIK